VTSLRRILPFALGFALTLRAFWPGLMTPDSEFQLKQARELILYDSFPIIMALAWNATHRVIPGGPGMLLLLLALYWGGFALFAWYCAGRSRRAFWLAAALPFLPFLINYAGTLWKDVLVLGTYLIAAGIILLSGASRWRWIAVVPLAIGIAARENSAAAAIPLFALLFWPTFSGLGTVKRLGAAFAVSLLIAAALFGGAQFGLSYVFKPIRTTPSASLALFDLTGISHRIGSNLVPGPLTPEEAEKLRTDCYEPKGWDLIWLRCPFAEKRARSDGAWATYPAAWLRAIAAHPIAYIKHRAAHTRSLFSTGDLAFITPAIMSREDPRTRGFVENPYYHLIGAWVAIATPTPLFWVGFWLALSFALRL
jgi:hypothetical protein